jgi:hypothetical protein
VGIPNLGRQVIIEQAEVQARDQKMAGRAEGLSDAALIIATREAASISATMSLTGFGRPQEHR